MIALPGVGFTAAGDWVDKHDKYDGPSNVDALMASGIAFPSDPNLILDIHTYLDEPNKGLDPRDSGIPACMSTTVGSERLKPITEWLEKIQGRAMLSEFAGDATATCLSAIDDLLQYVEGHPQAWVGYLWWSSGPAWGDHAFSLEPNGGRDTKAQMAVLQKYLKKVVQ